MSAVAARWTPRSLDEVMQYSHEPLLARYAESQGVPVHEARRRFDALKQFLFVCAVMPGTHAPSSVIATMWQAFLLSTVEYRRFCHGYLGRFIDHRTGATPSGEAYLATRRIAEGVLGELDEELWPTGSASASRDDSGRDG